VASVVLLVLLKLKFNNSLLSTVLLFVLFFEDGEINSDGIFKLLIISIFLELFLLFLLLSSLVVSFFSSSNSFFNDKFVLLID
jgi:hypothetical protein